MPSWTKEQLDAIQSTGENIIVSAGAGSGKTAVLTERIITKLKQGVQIDSLLVLTFTNAAAAEMKERIRKAILKEPSLQEALDMIDAAYITTFDSFALSVVRKYHDLLGLSKQVGIIDGSFIEHRKKKILSEIMEEEYRKEEADFSKLIRDFVLKDDQNITSMILDLYQKIDLIYDKENYLNQYIETFYQESYIEENIRDYLCLIDREKEQISCQLDLLSSEVDNKYEEKIRICLEPLLEANSYPDIKEALHTKMPNLPSGSSEEAKSYKQKISASIKHLKELCIYQNEEVIKKSILSTKDYVTAIIRIIKALDEKLMADKRSYHLFEFTDIAKFAIHLVRDYEEVKEELGHRFHEILVDEYQDTSDLQELFIEAISKNNVYMVGDIKQSIYRFRNANPDIFKEKYEAYQNHMGGKKIDLNKNFRSRNTVLENINHIFNQVMDLSIGGADYKKSHQLIFGNTSYTTLGMSNQNMNLEIYDYQIPKDYPFHKNEIEAFMIATDIKNKVENHYQVFDKDQGILRDVTYQDFAILIDQKKNFELYKKIFTYLQIPLEMNKESILTESTLIILIKNILTMVCSKQISTTFLHAYASIARSPIFEYSDTELFKRITSRNFDGDLLYEKISILKQILPQQTNVSLLEHIIEEFQLYDVILKLGDIDENLYRLHYLLDMAFQLSNLGYDVYQFTSYIKDIFDEGLTVKYDSKLGSGNAVKIMSIHKSKGLEFYICYFPELDSKWVLRDIKDRFMFDHKYGIVTPYYENGVRRTIYSELVKERYLQETISEKLRVFYVALTRAKEKMIMICNLKQIEDKNDFFVSDQTRMEYRSFQDVLCSIKKQLQEYITPYCVDNLPLSHDYQAGKITKIIDSEQTSRITIEEINPINIVEKKEVFSHKRNNLKSYEETMIMETGNYLHEVLECISLKEPKLSQLPISDVVKERVLTFLNQPLLQEIEKSEIYQEYEFIYEENHVKKHGIIDLMLVYPDHVDIIDYKLRNIEKKDYEAQLEGYRTYIRHITNKPVNIYLYSILDGKIKTINRRNYVEER